MSPAARGRRGCLSVSVSVLVCVSLWLLNRNKFSSCCRAGRCCCRCCSTNGTVSPSDSQPD